MLDLLSVRLFVLTVDLGSFTRAAETVGTVQPAVSQRIRQLEAALGHRLLERTPRLMRLTESGSAFLPKARALLAAHEAASSFNEEPPVRFALGASDHALGDHLEHVIGRVRAALPARALLEVRIAMSPDLRTCFEEGSLDAVVLRRDSGARDGEVLGRDPLGWRVAPGHPLDFDVLPLVTLGAPCGVRASAIRRLEEARRPWREVFTGGSCGAVAAAVRAGLGVAPMGEIVSGGLPDMGPAMGLPALPDSEIVLFSRSGAKTRDAIRSLAASVRSQLGPQPRSPRR